MLTPSDTVGNLTPTCNAVETIAATPRVVAEKRTLVVILTMHRSGSSVTANLLQRLGMSLGPFEMMAPAEDNRHGYFEAMPFYRLDMDVLNHVFGFTGDVPDSPEVLSRYCRAEGVWNMETAAVPPALIERGVELLTQLTQAGPLSGFKDPRVTILWPFWKRVFDEFPRLQTIPLFLVRSPHESAMSMFARGQGRCTYEDALHVTAVSLKLLCDIRRHWSGEQALVRFDPRTFASDMRKVADLLDLPWSDDVFRSVYDVSDCHYLPTRVDHPAQRFFDELSSLPRCADAQNAMTLARDSALHGLSMRPWQRAQQGIMRLVQRLRC
jgi:hypothetical protein